VCFGFPWDLLAQSGAASEPAKLAVWDSTAQLVGVRSEITQLRKLSGGGVSANRWQILWLHQHISELLWLSIDDLKDRAAMLEDVRARIAFLKGDLSGLLDSLPEVAESDGIVPEK
jgi:hypothetical protein